MSKIHSTAVIEKGAEIHDSVIIGPYCVIGAKVKLHANVELKSHVVIAGDTEIGEGTVVYPFASLGSPPQDLKFKGENSKLVIGKNNTIREHVTMNPGTEGGGLLTQVGDNCLFMASAHVAHDCIVGDNVILANNATIAGHVVVEDFAILGGLSGVHQYVRIGAHAMIGGATGVESDVIPYATALGDRANIGGLNLIGLKRRGFSREEIHNLRNAYKLLFSESGTIKERVQKVKAEYPNSDAVNEVIKFLDKETSRAICQPKNGADFE